MDKKGKIFQRKQREQPQQHKMVNPPLLEEKKVEEEETFEQWRTVNMQYRALFKKKNDKEELKKDPKNSKNPPRGNLSAGKRPQKEDQSSDNQMFTYYLNKKLENFTRTEEKIKRPALLIQSTEEMLRQLPKGEGLLEEAEIAASKVIDPDDNSEELLRSYVDDLHLKHVQRMESGYISTYDDLCKEIEELLSSNQELEKKIRKFSSQANSESEELEEVKLQYEQIQALEGVKVSINEEITAIEETISMINKDILEINSKSKERQKFLTDEIERYKILEQKIDNQKVESLEYECQGLYRDIQDIESDIKRIKEMWEGDNYDMEKIMEEFDENNTILKKELREITLSRNVVQQERANIKKMTENVTKERIEYLKKTEEKTEQDPRNLFIYFDNILNDYSRKIRMVIQEKQEGEIENTVKEAIESRFFAYEHPGDEKLKQARDTLSYLKGKHDDLAEINEKNTTFEVAEMISSFKGSDNRAISRSLKSIVNLSPIRKLSPARESSLSSLSRLRDITDKVIKHKRNSSTSSKGSKNSKSSIDFTLVSERKAEHARYLKMNK